MEAKLILIRHAVTDWHGQKRVLGQYDVSLNDEGRRQADALSQALGGLPLEAIVSSPLARAIQTAEPLARRVSREAGTDPRLTDLRVGEWEGMTFEDLQKRDDYLAFQKDPLGVRIPGGETLEEARLRAVAAVEEAAQGLDGGLLAVVTHSDIVRFLTCHYLGVPLSIYLRLQASVASVTALSVSPGKAKLLTANWRPSLLESAFPALGVSPEMRAPAP
jgi:probable phosphoglycerate mutase